MKLHQNWPALCMGCIVWLGASLAASEGGQPAKPLHRVRLGAGSYRHGFAPADDPLPRPWVSERWRGPVPTSDWSSSLVWSRFSEPMYAHPWAARYFDRGLALHVPAVSAAAIGVFGNMPPAAACDLRVTTTAAQPFADARLEAASDWFVTGVQRIGPVRLATSFGHGSPFVFIECRNADVSLVFPERPVMWAADASWVAFLVRGRVYAVFWDRHVGRSVADADGEGVVWRFSPRVTASGGERRPGRPPVGRPPVSRRAPAPSSREGRGERETATSERAGERTTPVPPIRLTVAALPRRSEALLAAYRSAAAHRVADTRVDWSYEPGTRLVQADFRWTLERWLDPAVDASADESPVESQAARAAGGQRSRRPETIICLYPHQWRHLMAEPQAAARPLEAAFRTVRGPMKLYLGTRFSTRVRLPPVLPALPPLPAVLSQTQWSELAGTLRDAAAGDVTVVSNRPPKRDTYWDGKWMAAVLDAAAALEGGGADSGRAADGERAAEWRGLVRLRLEDWFTADSETADDMHFVYHPRWGTAIGQPPSYGSDRELNDHHFHYGYFIRCAAELARHDPAWATRWDTFVQWLIRDIAAPRRDDPDFPFLRCFDPYAGHSWASGHARFADGNNQESSSEAMNAWFGVLLWGEATGQATWRDLGAFLYATEATAVWEYWYDAFGGNFPDGLACPSVAMVWGGKATHETWFSADPEMIHGINWLPLHGGSLYLAVPTGLAERQFRALVRDNGGTSWSDWADWITMYRALSDPQQARRSWDRLRTSVRPEAGNSRLHTEHWLAFFASAGRLEPSVWGDAPLSAVFSDGRRRTYCAFNPDRRQPRRVRFSDGCVITAEPGAWAVARTPIP